MDPPALIVVGPVAPGASGVGRPRPTGPPPSPLQDVEVCPTADLMRIEGPEDLGGLSRKHAQQVADELDPAI